MTYYSDRYNVCACDRRATRVIIKKKHPLFLGRLTGTLCKTDVLIFLFLYIFFPLVPLCAACARVREATSRFSVPDWEI